jgi:hypothetical protein
MSLTMKLQSNIPAAASSVKIYSLVLQLPGKEKEAQAFLPRMKMMILLECVSDKRV